MDDLVASTIIQRGICRLSNRNNGNKVYETIKKKSDYGLIVGTTVNALNGKI